MSANEADTPTLPGDTDTRGAGDVLELAAAEISPELIAADLADEVDVGAAVTIDIGNRDPVAVVVVRGFVGLAGIVDDPMPECDAAVGDAVGELEVVEHRRAGERLDLRVADGLEPGCVLQGRRHEPVGRARPFRSAPTRRRGASGRKQDSRDNQTRSEWGAGRVASAPARVGRLEMAAEPVQSSKQEASPVSAGACPGDPASTRWLRLIRRERRGVSGSARSSVHSR